MGSGYSCFDSQNFKLLVFFILFLLIIIFKILIILFPNVNLEEKYYEILLIMNYKFKNNNNLI
jgi:hypothetical protein